MAANAPLELTEIDATRRWVRDHQAEGRTVGLVPTMGALHEGHLSLARAAKSACDVVLTTVFVNPTQFGPGEDYERYPRDLERGHAARLAEVGVEAVFAPTRRRRCTPPAVARRSTSATRSAMPFEGRQPADPLRRRGDRGRQTLRKSRRPTAPTSARRTTSRRSSSGGWSPELFESADRGRRLPDRPRARRPRDEQPQRLPRARGARARGLALSSRPPLRPSALHAAGERDARPKLRDSGPPADRVHAADVRHAGVRRLRWRRGRSSEVDPRSTGRRSIAVAARVGQTRLIDNVRLH